MRLSEDQLRALQQAELGVLKQFISFCDSHGLMYFAVGGTALGCHKYSGFVPWDDDIDLAMPRNDYEKMLELAPKELSNALFVQTPETDLNYPYSFAKIRDIKTLYIEEETKDLRMVQGVFIDVFPIDEMSEKSFKRYLRKVKFYYAVMLAPTGGKRRRTFKGKIALFLSKFTKNRKLFRKIEKFRTAAKKGEIVCLQDIAYPKALVTRPRQLYLFNDLNIFSFGDVETFLKLRFGEIVTPPKDQQKPHHTPAAFSLHEKF